MGNADRTTTNCLTKPVIIVHVSPDVVGACGGNNENLCLDGTFLEVQLT